MARELSDQPVADVGAASIGNAFTREYLNEINRTVQPPVHHAAADPDVGDSWTKTAARVGGLLGYGALDELRYRPAMWPFPVWVDWLWVLAPPCWLQSFLLRWE